MNEQPYESESHSGVLKPTEHHASELFDVAGQQFLLHGTSGPPKQEPRMAEGRPVRHDVSVAASRSIPAEVTSGSSQMETTPAAERPVQRHNVPDAAPEPAGQGQLMGGPIRRA